MSEPTVTVPLAALIEVREMVADWGAYADDYFQEKWDLAGDIAKIDAILAAVETPAPDTLPNYPDHRLTIDQRADAIKAARQQGYKEGWNDREGDFLVAKDRVYGPATDTSDRQRLNRAMYKLLKRHGAKPDVLALAGSIGDTLEDGEIAELIEDWLNDGEYLHAPH